MDPRTARFLRGVAAAILSVLVLGACGGDSEPDPAIRTGASPVAPSASTPAASTSADSVQDQRKRAFRQAMADREDEDLRLRFGRQLQREAYPLLAEKLDHQKTVLIQLVKELTALESSAAPDTLEERDRLRALLRDYMARINQTEQALRTPHCFPN